VSYATFLLAGEHHFSQKLFTVCCVGYNIFVKYWFILNPTFDKTLEMKIRLQVIT